MPNPQVGSGPNESFGMQKYAYALYLAAASAGTATYMATKLLATEPPAPWQRQARLTAEDLTWNVPAPGFLDMRAGFNHSLKARVINQAEIPQVTVKFDEADPVVMAQLRGTTYTALSSGVYTGEEFIYKSGLQYLCKALAIGESQNSAREHQVYSGNASIYFNPLTDPSYEGMQGTLSFFDVSSSETFRIREWD